ncbi:MAG: sugar-transfer associated ATP-grasp domain-containing protein [Bacteroidota bacterium]
MKILNWLMTGRSRNPFLLGINERNRQLVYRHNERMYYQLADDKILTKSILEPEGIPCAKTYAIVDKIGDIEKCWNRLQNFDALAIKPSKGSGGGGIMILKKKSDKWYKNGEAISTSEILLHMAKIIMGQFSLNANDRVLIEECIESHDFFKKIYSDGVPDLRVILLNEKILMGMLRLPTAKSEGKANLHQGGLGIGIDLQKGTLLKAYDGESYHTSHPDSGGSILGVQLPFWKEILNLSIKTAEQFPLKYIGVDIVIDQNIGPMIMEINVRPGLGIQMANECGLKKSIFA